MNQVDQPRTSIGERLLSGRRSVVIVLWTVAGFWSFFIDLLLLVAATCCILDLDFCVLAYCGSAVLLLSLQSFYNYARGHCKVARRFAKVVRAWSETTRDVYSGLLSMLSIKTTHTVVRELSWGIWGRGERGLKGIVVSGSGYNEVLALGMLNVVDYVEQGRCAKLLESVSDLTLSLWCCRSRRACVRACVHPQQVHSR